MPSSWEMHGMFLLRIGLAVVLGGVLGWERERKNKSAGLKTHILISVAGCLLMWLSTYAFIDFRDHPNARFDPARLAAQVGGGIGGFLAAGVVLRNDKFALAGYSTAAMLLLSMIIGFAVGGGQYFVAITTVAVVMFCMVVLPPLQKRWHKPMTRRLTYISVDRPNLLAEIATILGQRGVNITDITIDESEEDDHVVRTVLELKHPSSTFDWDVLLPHVADVKDVLNVNLE